MLQMFPEMTQGRKGHLGEESFFPKEWMFNSGKCESYFIFARSVHRLFFIHSLNIPWTWNSNSKGYASWASLFSYMLI